jgi:hypothetical protein
VNARSAIQAPNTVSLHLRLAMSHHQFPTRDATRAWDLNAWLRQSDDQQFGRPLSERLQPGREASEVRSSSCADCEPGLLELGAGVTCESRNRGGRYGRSPGAAPQE